MVAVINVKQKMFTTTSREETQRLAKRLGTIINAPCLITMRGDLGAGKTTFTQGLAQGMGIQKTVNSPTFTILKIYYGGTLPLYHIDAYRLEGLHQDLGFEEYIDSDGVCLIEWPMFIAHLLPEEKLDISIAIEQDERCFTVTATGPAYETILEEWL